LLDSARTIEAPAIVFVTLKTSGTTARAATAKHHEARARFRRRVPWSMLGAFHLMRAERGGWFAHTHVLVFGNGSPDDLAAAIKEAWTEAGGNREAWVGRAQSATGALTYAVDGAVSAPDHSADFRAWMLATSGRHLVFRSRARGTIKRAITPATPRATTDARERIAARVLALVREEPMAASAIRSALTSGDRIALPAVLAALQRDGRLVPITGARGVRLAAA